MVLVDVIDMLINNKNNKKNIKQIRYTKKKHNATTTPWTLFKTLCRDHDAELFEHEVQKSLKRHRLKLVIKVDDVIDTAGLTNFDVSNRTITMTFLPPKQQQQQHGVRRIRMSRIGNRQITRDNEIVGGLLCNSYTDCMTRVFQHEYVHVLVLLARLDAELYDLEWKQLHKNSSTVPEHDVIHGVWLKKLFGHTSYDNSLLYDDRPAEFTRSLGDTEAACLDNNNHTNDLQAFHNGRFMDVALVRRLNQHYSVLKQQQQQPEKTSTFTSHNALLRCG
jgi:hypothetical protein